MMVLAGACSVLFCALLILPGLLYAEVVDAVAAFIDEEVITVSELDRKYGESKEIVPDITREEVLGTMINRALILKEARFLRIEGPDEDQVVNDYIDLKVRAFIKVTEVDIKAYYELNRESFEGRDFESQKEDIERLLQEKEVNKRLRRHIDELRRKAYIKVFTSVE